MLPRRLIVSAVVFLLICVVTTGESKQRSGSQTRDEENMDQSNEIDDRIQLSEPYRTVLQTSARFALSQTKLSRHVDLETAMDLINSAGYMLSKPSVLIKTVEATAVFIVLLLTMTFLYPTSYKFIETVWRDPANTFNFDRYLSNGLSEKSVLATIGSKTEDVLSRVGLQTMSCREKSLCYMGEIINCTFPKTAETISKFAVNHFPNSSIKDHPLAKAFISGFSDRNCTRVTSDGGSQSCIGNFFNSLMVSKYRNK